MMNDIKDRVELRDQLRNAVTRWGTEDQVSWMIFTIFMVANASIFTVANALITRQWLQGSFGYLLGFVVALFVWHPLQRRAVRYLYFFEDVVCALENELKKEPGTFSDRFLLTGGLNPRYKERVKGLSARRVMLFAIDGTALV